MSGSIVLVAVVHGKIARAAAGADGGVADNCVRSTEAVGCIHGGLCSIGDDGGMVCV